MSDCKRTRAEPISNTSNSKAANSATKSKATVTNASISNANALTTITIAFA